MTLVLTPYRDGRPQPSQPFDSRALHTMRDDPDVLLWVDVDDPGPEDFAILQDVFDLPPLAMDSVREVRQRPKLDMYGDRAFLVAYTARVREHHARHRVRFARLSLFAGPRFLVTVRHGKVPADDQIRARMTATGADLFTSDAALTHTVLDTVVDGYFTVLDDFEERIEAIDEQAYGGLDEAGVRRAFALRRDLVHFRRVVGPLREVLNGMARRQSDAQDGATDGRLRDLYDHVVTVYEDIELARDLLAADLEANLSAVSNRMNGVVLKVSAWAAIIAAPTVIASIYGMNFAYMPELRWHVGYPASLLLMLAVILGLYFYFKRKSWL